MISILALLILALARRDDNGIGDGLILLSAIEFFFTAFILCTVFDGVYKCS